MGSSTCARYCLENERERDAAKKFMRGRNEQPNRTKWTYLASPRINKQQQMTAYVRPFLRRRFHRSGSRSVKDPPSPPLSSRLASATLPLSLSERTSFSVILAPSSRFLPDSWTARGDPPCGGLRGSFARRSLPIAGFVVTFTSVSIFGGMLRGGRIRYAIRERVSIFRIFRFIWKFIILSVIA